MQIEVRSDSVLITGYVNAVERLSKPIRENIHGRMRTFLERIKAGVFRSALKKNDNVLVLLNHDNNRVLASTGEGSAILEEDNIGLRAEITITDSEVVQKARDGRLTGWSFGFIANDDELSNEGSNEIRTVTDMELLEVSILDDAHAPAYYGTSIESRMEGGARVVHIRLDNMNEAEEQSQEQEQVVSVEELATLVAAKVIEALKTEEKAESETEDETEEQTEEQSEETEEEKEEQTEETEEETEEEKRSLSDFENRLSELMK